METPDTTPTPEAPFHVDFVQHGNGETLAVFATQDDAVAFAQKAWADNHDGVDFMCRNRPEERARWTVWRAVFTEGSHSHSHSHSENVREFSADIA